VKRDRRCPSPLWKFDETETLMTMWCAGIPVMLIGLKIRRSASACESKIDRLRAEGKDLPMRNPAGRARNYYREESVLS